MAWRGAGLLMVVLLPVLFSTDLQAHAGEVQEMDAAGLVISSKDFMRHLHVKGRAAPGKQFSSKSIGKNENLAHIHDWAMAQRKTIARKANKKEVATQDKARRQLAKDARFVRRATRVERRKAHVANRKLERDTRQVRRASRKAMDKGREASRRARQTPMEKGRQAARKRVQKQMKKSAAKKAEKKKLAKAKKKVQKAKAKAKKETKKLTVKAKKVYTVLKKEAAARSASPKELGESMETLNTAVHKMSDADRAALNLEAAQAFPEQAPHIIKLRKQLAPALRQAARLRRQTAHVHKSVLRREKLLDSIETKHEFDLMTNPMAESAQLSAESKLKSLSGQEDGLSRQTRLVELSTESLARRLAKQEAVQELNRKSVMLFRNFKSHYKKKVSLESAKFKAHALRAAESAAKVRYHTYAAKMRHRLGEDKEHLKASLLHMQQEREAHKRVRISARVVRSKQRAVRRAARLAEEEAHMHREAKIQAARMFKQYMARYHEVQQKEYMEDSQQDLGEASAIEAKPAKHAGSDNLDHILDRVSNTVRSLPKHTAPKSPQIFGLDSN